MGKDKKKEEAQKKHRKKIGRDSMKKGSRRGRGI